MNETIFYNWLHTFQIKLLFDSWHFNLQLA